MSNESNNKKSGFTDALAGIIPILTVVYLVITGISDYDSNTRYFILGRDLSTLILSGITLWITFKQEADTAFLNFIALILGVLIYFVARYYGITIQEFFDKTGFLSYSTKFIGNIVVPSAVGFMVTNWNRKIYNKKSKIRMGILLFTMLTLVIRELFDGRIHSEFSYIIDRLKPNIFFLVGTLLSLIFHPVQDD